MFNVLNILVSNVLGKPINTSLQFHGNIKVCKHVSVNAFMLFWDDLILLFLAHHIRISENLPWEGTNLLVFHTRTAWCYKVVKVDSTGRRIGALIHAHRCINA